MRYSVSEFKKMLDTELKTTDDMIKFDILNFIRVIHLNKQNFIESSFNTNYYGDRRMTFLKKEGQVIGIIHVHIVSKGREMTYIFNDKGYELLEDLLGLI